MRFPRLTIAALFAAAAPALGAQELGDRLQVHGSLNAAYAQADTLPIFGAPTKGTTDYRALALQFRYAISDDDAVVVQFLNRRIGTSPLQGANPDVALNWGFYQHREGDWTIRVGRNPLPRGFFNETRFIGTVLPLFRTGPSVYGETLETVDGLVVSRRADLPAGFGLEGHAFAGGSNINVLLPFGNTLQLIDIRLERFVGLQTFLTTPVPGTRLGGFLASYNGTGTSRTRTFTWQLSAETVHDRWFARAEATSFVSDAGVLADQPFDQRQANTVDYLAGYAHAGVKPLDQLTFVVEVNGNRQRLFLPSATVPGAGTLQFPNADLYNNDLAIGASWAFSPTLIAKIEGHEARGYGFDVPVPLVNPGVGATGPITPVLPPTVGRYIIASLAVSF